ncbi:MAG: hypothetical protein NTV51_19140 [Verrucomicrobia bacterium]|nr:hypothetical protein [Verrucomicrobiota bacterium]
MFLVDGEPVTPVDSLVEANAFETFGSGSMRRWVEGWFSRYGRRQDLKLVMRRVGSWQLPQSLVCIGGEWHRAHLEQTFCDGCGHRVRAAAVLDVDSTAGLSEENKRLVDLKASRRHILSCPRCGERYRKRQVFWLWPEETEPNLSAMPPGDRGAS